MARTRSDFQMDTAARVAVIGAGTMGQGIAQLACTAGFGVRLHDSSADQLGAATKAIAAQLERQVAKAKMSSADRDAALSRLTAPSTVAEACAGVDVVIEAVPERMDLKVALFREAKAVAKPDALLASNTSSLSITELGARVEQAERVIGMHFFNPPPVMELLEVVRGIATSEATVDRALTLAKALGKTPILVRDMPGFATSRLGVLLGAEAIRMVESGVASAADIDRGMELGYRHAMGPLKLTDLVGLDVRLMILEHLHKELGEQFRPPPLLRQMVRAGKLGKKAGEGFYVWRDGQPVPR
jgi:3-hydroxybutyryl-CoA dehydrogenase